MLTTSQIADEVEENLHHNRLRSAYRATQRSNVFIHKPDGSRCLADDEVL